MSLEPPELVALRRALGRQLAALRHAAEVGQRQVAHRTGYSRSSVAHAEAGRQLLTRNFWKTADELVKADGALMAGYERVQAAKQEYECQSREAELAAARAKADALRATTAPQQLPRATDRSAAPVVQGILASLVGAAGGEPAADLAGPLVLVALLGDAAQAVPVELKGEFAGFLCGWADRVNRRELFQVLGWTAATTVPASSVDGLVDVEERERFDRAVSSPSRVDAQVVDRIEVMFGHCRRQEDALGPHAVLRTVLDQRTLVDTLLAECSAALRPRLLSVYSSMSSSVGTYFFDLDDPAGAMRYQDQAREAAQEARNIELAMYTLCNMSYFASWHGKAHAGIDFAAAAQSLAGKTDDVLLQACAAERAASAYGVDGQYKECMKEFDRALDVLALPVDRRSPESPVYYFHEGLVASKQSECLLRLGKPVEAAAAASRGIQLFDNSFTHGLAYCTLRLGTARLLSGEVEEGVRVVGEGALLGARIRSTRLTSEVRAARGRMRPWADTAAVKALDEQLAELGLGA